MGFAFLYEATGDASHLKRAIHFLNELKKSRCVDFKEYCWGYPFDWVWRNGVIKQQTPLITTTPYVYEAFLQLLETVERTDFQTSNPPPDLRPLTSAPRPRPSDGRPLGLPYAWRRIL